MAETDDPTAYKSVLDSPPPVEAAGADDGMDVPGTASELDAPVIKKATAEAVDGSQDWGDGLALRGYDHVGQLSAVVWDDEFEDGGFGVAGLTFAPMGSNDTAMGTPDMTFDMA